MSTDPLSNSPHEGNEQEDDFVGGNSSATSLNILTDVATTTDDSPSSTPGNSGLFFADATLDLSEAHDFAETPEPCRMVLQNNDGTTKAKIGGLMEMPILEHSTTSTAAKQSSTVPSPAHYNTKKNMNRITSQDLPSSSNMISTFPSNPPRRPRRPRDIPWAVSFVLLCPTVLLTTSLFTKDYTTKFTQGAQGAVFYCIVLGYAATMVLARVLYHGSSNNSGEEARHVATLILVSSVPISVAIYALLGVLILVKTPHAKLYAILPFVACLSSIRVLRRIKSRQLFFQALVNMSLTVTSKALGRKSFYRVVSTLLGLQICMVVWWKLSVFGAISRGSIFWLVLSLVCGKWWTATLARVLGLISSGGVATWFIQQSQLLQEMQQAETANETTAAKDDDASDDYNVGYSTSMQEEYQTADASAYQSVLNMEDDDDGDADDEMFGDEDEQAPTTSTPLEWTTGGSTCKSFLIAAVTTSLGSVAQCGLLGGLAQVTWSFVRNTDALLLTQGFSRMQIGMDGRVSASVLLKLVTQANVFGRRFVKTHSDLAMCHVAVYYKSYQKAATDVMMLVDASGVEPIIQDDMTTHVCSSVCGSVSGLVVILVGTILSHRRSGNLTDEAIVQSMILAFIFCYTLLFTVMEPLRASIKAFYVCFAQHPQSLSQAFPLIFHRLSRISEANLA